MEWRCKNELTAPDKIELVKRVSRTSAYAPSLVPRILITGAMATTQRDDDDDEDEKTFPHGSRAPRNHESA